MSPSVSRSLTSFVAMLVLLAFFPMPTCASAISGPQLFTFDDFEEGTEISTQYADRGIVFADEEGFYPEIRWDESAWTNPVLSGTFGFGSPIRARFVVPGTSSPATVENLAMDIGYVDEPGSTELVVNHADGSQSEAFAEEYGFNHLFTGVGGISGFEVEAVGEEPQGFELDNLEYTIPAPPPPPPPPAPAPSCPSFVILDSRGSGETKGKVSHPGVEFKHGFEERLRALHRPHSVRVQTNEYPAVGVFDKSLKILLNGIGAFMHSSWIGAYKDSEREGESELLLMVAKQLKSACVKHGSTKMAMLGYSQGAEVTGNVYENLSTAIRKKIAAVVLWGDPQYNHDDRRADRDDRTRDGLLGRRAPFPDPSKVFSYCNKHDPVCQYPLARHEYLWYRTKEHSLYWKSKPPEAENDGKEVASFLH